MDLLDFYYLHLVSEGNILGVKRIGEKKMQDLIIEFLKSINVLQLVAMGAILWFFYIRLNEKAEKNKSELKQEINEVKTELKQEAEKNKSELKQEINALKNELKQEIEKLSMKVDDTDRRLCRIEGSLSTHGHCLFNQRQPEKKAE